MKKNISKFLLAFAVLALVAAGCTKKTDNNNNQQQTQSGPIKYQGQQGRTALDLLKANYQVETKNFSGIGEMVQSINGQKADDKHFWLFMVNGQEVTVGAGSYVTKDGETIEWKLQETNPNL